MLQRASNVIVREEENCFLLVNRGNGRVLVINRTGLEIWQLLENSTVEDVVEKLTERYKVKPANCRAQVTSFVEKLLKNDFLSS